MKYFDWNKEKNLLLIEKRNISFEEVVFAIKEGKLIDVKKHPNKDKYPNQSLFYININDYVYVVPFVEDDEKLFLKTIYPDRIATKNFLGGK